MKRFAFPVFLTFILVASAAARQSAPGGSVAAKMAGFAASVAVDADAVYVGEPGNTITPGFVYVFTRNATGDFAETSRLRSPQASAADGFGAALAVRGELLAASAPSAGNGAGLVVVFRRDASRVWRPIAELRADEAMPDVRFGASVALGDRTVLVGAPGSSEGAGAVYVFEPDGADVWVRTAKLMADESMPDDAFGTTVGISDAAALIGAPGRDGGEGVVYDFRREGTAWAQRAELSAFGLSRGSLFGGALAVEDAFLAIAAPRHERSTGTVFTYLLDEGEWNQTGTLLPFDAAPNMRFGSAIAVFDGSIWIGAPGADRSVGAVYAITRSEAGVWDRAEKLTPDDGERRTQFGAAVAANGRVVAAGRPGADGGAGSALIYESSGDGWTETAAVQGAVEAMESITGSRVTCEDGAAGAFGCEGVDLVSFLSIKDLGGGRGVRLNDVWGWTDPQTEKEWALVGRTNGTAFIDISDPAHPIYAGDLMLTDGANASTWRDIKVYRDHAFIVADAAGGHGMQVFDLTRLRTVEDAPMSFDEDAVYEEFASAHNIVVNEDTGFAYAVGASGGGRTCGGGLHMIDIRQPKSPQFAGCFSDTATGREGTGYSHDAMCIVYHGPDTEHEGREICFGANETALSIADVSDKESPVALSSASYPNVSYAHQGWITEDHRYFYLDDELDELQGRVRSTRTLIWDVTDLDDPQLVKEHQSAVKASDHNLYIRGNYMYQSNYVAGLRVLDISDPANPVEVGYFDTLPFGENEPGFAGSWSNYPYFGSGNIVVTGISEGLFVVRRREVDI